MDWKNSEDAFTAWMKKEYPEVSLETSGGVLIEPYAKACHRGWKAAVTWQQQVEDQFRKWAANYRSPM